jgi:hypothetical protein
MGGAEPTEHWAEVPTSELAAGERLYHVNGTFRMRKTQVRKVLKLLRAKELKLSAGEMTMP